MTRGEVGGDWRWESWVEGGRLARWVPVITVGFLGGLVAREEGIVDLAEWEALVRLEDALVGRCNCVITVAVDRGG